MRNLLPYCNALDFEPYRDKKMSMQDEGYIGYRDEINTYFTAITNSHIPKLEFLNTDNYKECVLKAVNLGDDTDTVGAVVGGLASLYYGFDEIPEEWLNVIPKKDWIMELVTKL